MSDSAARQRALKQRRLEAGIVQCNVWLPAAAVPEFQAAAARIMAEPHLRIGPLVDVQTGRLCSLDASKSRRLFGRLVEGE